MNLKFLLLCALTAHFCIAIALTAQFRRIWLQDHCQNGICTDIEIGSDDFVIMSQSPVVKRIMLTFMNSSIAKIPHLMFDTLPDLQVLRMENCSLKTFEKPQFEGASNLMSLFLGHNQLRDIPKNIFLGADNLNTLMLNDNRIRNLHNESFNALRELKVLSLEGNQLEHLSLGVFATMRKLLDLNLANNRLQGFPRGIFDKNPNLTSLNLAYNQFKAFESKLLKFQPRITILNLSGNLLQEMTLSNNLTVDTFVANDCDLRILTINGLVKELDLRNNSLTALPNIAFAENVTSLDISSNPLGTMQGNPLRRFIGLLRLNLSATNLHDMPESVFKKQTQLKMLDISGNSFNSLNYIIFDSLKALQYFYFQENNWNCDFLQLMMNSFVKQRDISFNEDTLEPELVDDYVFGVGCWYESNKSAKKCGDTAEAALELAIVRNDIKAFIETVDKKFIKVYRMLEEIKIRL